MKLLKKIPFFLFLLVLFFCLHGSVENYGYLRLYEVIEVGGIILLCMAIFFVLIWGITKNYLFAALLTFFVALWYLFFGAIHDIIKSTPLLRFMQAYTVLLPALLLVNIIFIWWLKKSKPLYQKLMLYLNVLFIIFCLWDVVLLVNKAGNFKQSAYTSQIKFDKSRVTAKPNVYFLLFDCYAGYKSLQDSFAFKNDSLYNFLVQKSFTVLPSFSNYNFTFFSMASMLNMQYITDDYRNKIAVQEDMQQRVNEIKNGEVFSIFNSMQYNIENYSIFDLKNKKGISKNNTIIPMHAYLLTNKILHNRLILDLGYLLFRFNYFSRKHIFEHNDNNVTAYNKTIAAIEKKTDPPKFVYAHFLMPHAPYFKDSLGNFLPINEFNISSKKSYLSYLKYTNTIIKSVLTKITTADPNAIVLLMSDHGYNDKGAVRIYDTLQIAAEQYSFNNICAVRFPNQQADSVKAEMSSVNIFRYLFNSQFAQRIPYLKDSTVWVNHD
jgi:Sulfatase